MSNSHGTTKEPKSASHKEAKELRKVYLSMFPVSERWFKHIRSYASATHAPTEFDQALSRELNCLFSKLEGNENRTASMFEIDATQVEVPTSKAIGDFQTAAFFLADQILDEYRKLEFRDEIFRAGSHYFSKVKDYRLLYRKDDDLEGIYEVLIRLVKFFCNEANKFEKSGNETLETKFDRLVVLGDRLVVLADDFTNSKELYKYHEDKTSLGMHPLPSTKTHMAAMFKELGIPKNYGIVAWGGMNQVYSKIFRQEVYGTPIVDFD